MGVDDVGKMLRGALQLESDYRLSNQLGRVGPDDVDAQDLAVLLIGDDLDEAVVRAHDAGARVGGERELADLYVVPQFLRLGFRQAHAADLGMAVSRVGNAQLVDGLHRLAGNVRHGNDAFHRARVRQLRKAHSDVADGVDAGLGGTHVLIDFHEAALDLDLSLLDADVLRARRATDGDQHLVGLDLLLLAVHREGHSDAVLGTLDGFDLGVDEAVDAALAVHTHQFLGDFFVFHWHVAGQHLEDSHVSAEGLVDAGELDAYRTGADHDQRLRDVVEAEDFNVSQDAVVGLESGQHARD